MKPVNIGNSLVLRELAPTDVSCFFDMIDRNRHRLRDYFPITTAEITTKENCQIYFDRQLADRMNRAWFCFVIADQASELQGLFFLKNINWRIPKAEFAYFIDEKLERKGIMTTAFKFLIVHCFEELGFNRLYLVTMKENLASRRLAEKCGFQYEGTMRNDFRMASGELVDDVLYGLLKEDEAQ